MLGEGEKFVGNPLSCRTIDRMDAMRGEEIRWKAEYPNIEQNYAVPLK